MAGVCFRLGAPPLRRIAAVIALTVVVIAAGVAPAYPAHSTLAGTERMEVNAMEYPWSAIGRVNAAGRGHCTGVLIGERNVLTAAHCLYDTRNQRWRVADDLHFVAGYQRDAFLIHSRVRSYVRSESFDVGTGAATTNSIADWAVLTLRDPIGQKAGWLGLQRLDRTLLKRLRRGEARALQAGYRRGWTHIMSVNLDCEVSGFFQQRKGFLHSCNIAKGDSGSPVLVFDQGTFRVAGLNVLNASTKDGKVAGALSAGLFHPNSGSGQAVRAVQRSGKVWSEGRAPAKDSPASAVPLKTIDDLLGHLGHLDRVRIAQDRDNAGPEDRRAAIAAFQAQAGLPVTGEPSLALLGRLIQAAAR